MVNQTSCASFSADELLEKENFIDRSLGGVPATTTSSSGAPARVEGASKAPLDAAAARAEAVHRKQLARAEQLRGKEAELRARVRHCACENTLATSMSRVCFV